MPRSTDSDATEAAGLLAMLGGSRVADFASSPERATSLHRRGKEPAHTPSPTQGQSPILGPEQEAIAPRSSGRARKASIKKRAAEDASDVNALHETKKTRTRASRGTAKSRKSPKTRPMAKDEDADCDSDELSENLIADAAVLAGLARGVNVTSEQQAVADKLKNFCKNRKALLWATAEFFESTIDNALFQEDLNGPESYTALMRRHFPKISQIEDLTRIQRSAMRRMLPPPRRFSPALIARERERLNRRRSLVRQLQHGNDVGDIASHALPTHVPMPLMIGQRVLAQVWDGGHPSGVPLPAGIAQGTPFPGFVLAVNHDTAEYCVEFDRIELGRRWVVDIAVSTTSEHGDPVPTVDLIAAKSRPTDIAASRAAEVIRQAEKRQARKAVEKPPTLVSSSPLRERLGEFVKCVRARLLSARGGELSTDADHMRLDLGRLLLIKQELLVEVPHLVAEGQTALTRTKLPSLLKSQLAFITRSLETINSTIDEVILVLQSMSAGDCQELPNVPQEMQRVVDTAYAQISGKAEDSHPIVEFLARALLSTRESVARRTTSTTRNSTLAEAAQVWQPKTEGTVNLKQAILMELDILHTAMLAPQGSDVWPLASELSRE